MPRDSWKSKPKRKPRHLWHAKLTDSEREHVHKTSRERIQTWDSKIWFGIHKGKTLAEIPHDYLIWLRKFAVGKHWRLRLIKQFLDKEMGET